MSQKKTDILNHMITYVPSRYVSQFVGFFTSLFMKRFLGPFFAGTWDLLKLIMSYVDYSELGTTLTVYYKLPLLGGQDRRQEAAKIRDNVFTFVMLCSLVAGVGLFIYAILFRKHLSPEIYWGLISSSVLVIFERVHSFYVILLRANKDYSTLSKSIYFDAIVNLLFVLLIVSRFRFYGLLVAINILTVLNIIFIRHFAAFGLGFSLDWRAVVSYIKFGFPMYLTSILTMLMNNLDRLMIAGLLGLQQLGFYSIAMMSKSYSHQLSTNFSHVTSPHFMEDFGRYGNSRRIQAYIVDGTFALSCFMSVVLGLIFIYSTPVISLVLPSFLPGLAALKIFLLTSLFSSLVSFPTNYVVTQEKQSKLIIFALIALSINFVLNLFFIGRGWGINGVSVSTAISSFIYLLIILIFAMRHFANSVETIKYLLKIFLPSAYAVAVLLLVGHFIKYPDLLVNAIIQSLIFVLFSGVIALFLEKETGLVKLFLGIIKNKFNKNG